MTAFDPNRITVAGAREHNLADVSLSLPKGKLICFTGVSGSGKSSLAFDTLYAEGQRRYIESLSSYARQFMGELPKPDVDQISGLAPAVSIQQKTSGWNPRSTVGTVTQIHDYLRVLYARAGTAHCPQCHKPIQSQTREHMLAQLLTLDEGARVILLAPVIRSQKGEHKDLFADLLQRGFVRARVNAELIDLAEPPPLDRYRRHDIEVVIDRLQIRAGIRTRAAEALDLALQIGDGVAIAMIYPPADPADKRRPPTAPRDLKLSAGNACRECGLSFEPPTPQLFSFNSPQGMCDYCDGLGTRVDFDPDLLVPDPRKHFLSPCIAAFRAKIGRWRRHIYQGVADHLGINLKTPWQELPDHARAALLYGTGDTHITFEWRGRHGRWKHGNTFEGVIAELHNKYRKTSSAFVRRFYEQFMRQTTCPKCRGGRLNPQALAVRLSGTLDREQRALNLHELCNLPIRAAQAFCATLAFDDIRALIATEPLKEIHARLQFLLDVGLDYLTLDRAAPTLSGGESQRIRLASQIGSGLVGVLYVLDEPSIGLHPRDNDRLLASLKRLRDQGNTVIVVEHDRDTMEAADLIVDFGPGPGVRGGKIVAQGDLKTLAENPDSVTGAYLAGRAAIDVPAARRPIVREPAPPVRKRKKTTRKKSP